MIWDQSRINLDRRIKLYHTGSNWIKLDQIGSNFEKAILKKHALEKYVRKFDIK